jgi:hypothetical protein
MEGRKEGGKEGRREEGRKGGKGGRGNKEKEWVACTRLSRRQECYGCDLPLRLSLVY